MVFRKGFSGNPSGSRNRRVLTDTLVSRLLWPADEKPRKGELRTAAHVLVENMVQKALQGDMRAITEIYDRVEGKAVATTLHTEVKEQPMDIMEAARRLAFALNSAALLGQPVDDRFAKLADVTHENAPNS